MLGLTWIRIARLSGKPGVMLTEHSQASPQLGTASTGRGQNGGQRENLVGDRFAAVGLAVRNLCWGSRANLDGDGRSSCGSEDVTGFGWLSQLAEWRPELRELQAIRRAFVLSDGSRPGQSERVVQDLRCQVRHGNAWGWFADGHWGRLSH